jgi:hypothetical protein
VPEAWFAWVRRGVTRDLPRVVQHNYWDLLALGALLPALRDGCEQPATSGVDTLAVARHWRRQGDEQRAYDYLRAHRAQLGESALLELAGLGRRRGDWGLAMEIWNGLAERGSLEAIERLAKYYEHVAKEANRALCCTRELMRRGYRVEAQRVRESRLLRRCRSEN